MERAPLMRRIAAEICSQLRQRADEHATYTHPDDPRRVNCQWEMAELLHMAVKEGLLQHGRLVALRLRIGHMYQLRGNNDFARTGVWASARQFLRDNSQQFGLNVETSQSTAIQGQAIGRALADLIEWEAGETATMTTPERFHLSRTRRCANRFANTILEKLIEHIAGLFVAGVLAALYFLFR